MPAGTLDQAWHKLRLHLHWMDQPWIGFVFCEGSAASAELIRRTQAELSGLGRSLRVLRPTTPGELRNLSHELLSADTSTECLWVEGVRLAVEGDGADDPWIDAWSWLLQRLNERRERILRRLRAGLVLSMPRRMKPLVAALAPDLWSIRSLALDSGPARRDDRDTSLILEDARVHDRDSRTGGGSTLALALAELRRLERRLPEAQPAERERLLEALAGARLRAAGELLDAGQPSDALEHATAALDLAGTSPALAARAHTVLAGVHRAFGEREAEVDDLERAVALYRKLEPEGDRPALAEALHQLGNMLSALGRREEALDATAEVVEIYRQLAEDRPDAFLPDLAGSLNNLGAMFSALGHRDEALEATAQAVEIYRQLAKDRPDAFLPDLAGSLSNLGIRLSNLGRREEALDAASEAVQIYRRLVKDRPGAFLPDLARSLSNLGADLSDLGRREEALDASSEAVQLYRRLAEDRPAAFLPGLAMSLNNLGRDLSRLRRREEALDATSEAVQIYRQLAKNRPDAFLPDVAGSLSNLGILFSGLGRHQDAVEVAREAVEIFTMLTERWPEAFAEKLRVATRNLQRALQNVDGRPEAIQALGRARDLLERIGAE